MELIQGTHKASNSAPHDYISDMPDNVVTNILDRLPLQHAVRTSILSTNWRFKWTMLSQLVLDENFFRYLRETIGEDNCGGIISRLLLHIKGVVDKFVLSMNDVKDINDVENINHWIFFLSKNIKDLTLKSSTGTHLKLPTHLFSCIELKHLKLYHCFFHPPNSFHGFPNLLSLELCWSPFESSQLGEFLTRCPSLEILDMSLVFGIREVKLLDIAKSKNLKKLTLSLFNIDAVTISSAIFELVVFLPNLQELDLDFVNVQQLGLGFLDSKLTDSGAIKKFPTACLKALKLSRIDLGNGILLSCVLEMIRHFPNLQTLKISAMRPNDDPIPIPKVECKTTGLRSVVFGNFAGSDNEVCLIKYLLACSPLLEKMVIHRHWSPEPSGLLTFARKLLKLSRASTAAEIDFN